MPKRKLEPKQDEENFGKRLARLRKSAGYSQRELATEIGISNRMIAYYEGETQYPPTHLLPILSKALGVTSDQIMGIETAKVKAKANDTRLWRRFNLVEKLPPPKRKQIVQILDSFLENEMLKKTG